MSKGFHKDESQSVAPNKDNFNININGRTYLLNNIVRDFTYDSNDNVIEMTVTGVDWRSNETVTFKRTLTYDGNNNCTHVSAWIRI